MKLWQLNSIVGTEIIFRVATTRAAWKKYELFMSDYNRLVQIQDRVVLDSQVDTDFVVAVLSNIEKYCFLSQDGWLRSYRMDNEDSRLSFVECFRKYGGEILEDVCEKGSFNVG